MIPVNTSSPIVYCNEPLWYNLFKNIVLKIIHFFYFNFHVVGENNIIIGKISSLPACIPKLRITFEKLFNSAKLNAGPTFPNHGPILLNVAATALKAVIKSSVE